MATTTRKAAEISSLSAFQCNDDVETRQWAMQPKNFLLLILSWRCLPQKSARPVLDKKSRSVQELDIGYIFWTLFLLHHISHMSVAGQRRHEMKLKFHSSTSLFL